MRCAAAPDTITGMTHSSLRVSLRLVPISLVAAVLLAACAIDPAEEDAGDITAAAETTIAATTTSVAPTVPETVAETVADTTPATTPAVQACSPLPVSGVTDLLVSDAESFANTLGASAVANWDLMTFGLECAFGASGISGVGGPDEASTPGAFSATSAPLDTKAGDGIMAYAVMDTTGSCALRAIVKSAENVGLFNVTAPVVTCSAYEALDGYDAGQFSPV